MGELDRETRQASADDAESIRLTDKLAKLERELSVVYGSSSWRLTKPLRDARRVLSKGRQIARDAPVRVRSRCRAWLTGPVGYSGTPAADAAFHVRVEHALVYRGTLEISGWAFHETSPVAAGMVGFPDLEVDRRVPLSVGAERADVYAVWRQDNALRSGFKANVPLQGASPERVRVEFEVTGIRTWPVSVRPRYRRLMLERTLRQIWRVSDRRRVAQGMRCLVRGDWLYLWSRVVWLTEGLASTDRQPVSLRRALELLDSEASEPARLAVPVDIVIPVYNGFEFLPPLLRSIERNTSSPYRLIVIDDASPDPRVWPLLQELVAEHAQTLLLQNETNQGFVGTVNCAARRIQGDWVLLNTDVEVPPAWLERLMAPIHRDRTIASTTPFSNAATVCSFPEIGVDNPPLANLDVERIDRWFRRLCTEPPAIELPTGVGFCMGMNAAVWEAIGAFDEKTFRRGYGEENDWCQRAKAAGYRSVMASNLFVHHKHGGSFDSTTRASLRAGNLRKLLALHPQYQRRVDAFVRADPARSIRQVMTMLVACGEAPRKPVLLVDHELGGGANSYRERAIEERLAADQPVLLLTARRGGSLLRESIGLRCLYRQYSADFEVEDLGALESLLVGHIGLGEIFYNDAVSYARPAALAAMLHGLKRMTGARLTVAVHDFYALCPSFNLLNAQGVYCRLPDIATCRACLPRDPYAANPEGVAIDSWRRSWGALLGAAERILCFSEDGRRHILKVYPDCAEAIEVHPHALASRFVRKPRLNYDGPLHVGVVGAIGYAKGARVVADLGRYMLEALPEARITVIGVIANAPRLANLGVTGRYSQHELPELLERHGVNVCFLPSICPETFSYVTEELMALAVPLACFDIGAPCERVRAYGGKVIPLACELASLASELEETRRRFAVARATGQPPLTPRGWVSSQVSKTMTHGEKIERFFDGDTFRGSETTFDAHLIVICFTNRSGSTYLCHLLASANALPLGGEGLNYENVKEVSQRNNLDSFGAYMGFLVKERARNGYFVIKMGFEQFKFMEEWGWLEAFDGYSIVFMSREDTLDQAISFSIADQTKRWSSVDKGKNVSAEYSFADIRNRLESMERINTSFRQHLVDHGYDFYECVYEKLAEHPEDVAKAVAAFAGKDIVVNKAAVGLERQSGSDNREFRQKYLRDAMSMSAS